jgi:hypothetical protein
MGNKDEQNVLEAGRKRKMTMMNKVSEFFPSRAVYLSGSFLNTCVDKLPPARET